MKYTIGGSAVGGSDYALLSGSATIPAGKSAATIKVTVIDDSELEGPETVDLAVTPGAEYSRSLKSKARVMIVDNERAPR